MRVINRSIQKALVCLLVMVTGYRQVAAQTTTISNNGRYYCVNRPIGGNSATEDGAGPNYILLHQAYNGTLLDDHLIMGKITGIRGTTSSWNRKWTVEVNTASAYDGDRGSILTYNESQDVALVTLTYGGAKYLAIQIMNGSSMSGFSFTGYVYNESLTLVTDDAVSNVQEFTALDPLSIQGALYVGDRIGVGTSSPAANLHVVGNGVSTDGGNDFRYSGNAIIQANSDVRSATNGASLEFAIPAGGGDNFWGQGRIITVAGNQNNADATGKMILGTRRSFDKLGTGAQWYYGDDIVIDGSGNVGIGTTDPKGYKLAVAGNMIATEVTVKLQAQWPDYVFDSAYTPQSLAQVAQFIKDNKHLPNVPSAEEVKKAGVNLGDNQAVLLKKIEELTLYAIKQDATIQSLEEKMQHLEKLVKAATTVTTKN